ncbi:MAG TPA: ABC transporter substrate-binding protein, partial [Methanothrix soehngenii]|nr:ABC transporter substrate-binding protein [Methanothrix soehngenii]
QAILDEVKSRDGWDNIEAVKNGRVYLISNELMTGLDSIVGYLYWTKMLHPEFSADPDGAYEEYLTEFLGIEYPDLIFGYPLPD